MDEDNLQKNNITNQVFKLKKTEVNGITDCANFIPERPPREYRASQKP